MSILPPLIRRTDSHLLHLKNLQRRAASVSSSLPGTRLRFLQSISVMQSRTAGAFAGIWRNLSLLKNFYILSCPPRVFPGFRIHILLFGLFHQQEEDMHLRHTCASTVLKELSLEYTDILPFHINWFRVNNTPEFGERTIKACLDQSVLRTVAMVFLWSCIIYRMALAIQWKGMPSCPSGCRTCLSKSIPYCRSDRVWNLCYCCIWWPGGSSSSQDRWGRWVCHLLYHGREIPEWKKRVIFR